MHNDTGKILACKMNFKLLTYTYTAQSTIAKHRQQRMNVALTGEIKPSFNMTMWRRHALRVSAVITETEIRVFTNKLSIDKTCADTTHTSIFSGIICSVSKQARFNVPPDTQCVISVVFPENQLHWH